MFKKSSSVYTARGGIGSSESILELLKSLKIRALVWQPSSTFEQYCMIVSHGQNLSSTSGEPEFVA
jgi:hypothetical protein